MRFGKLMALDLTSAESLEASLEKTEISVTVTEVELPE